MKVLVDQSCQTLCNLKDIAARLLCPWNSPDENTEVSIHSLLQGIFLIQGFNSGLLHCRQTLYCLSHHGSSKNVSQPSNSTIMLHRTVASDNSITNSLLFPAICVTVPFSSLTPGIYLIHCYINQTTVF